MLIEDVGRESLEQAARQRPADEVRALYAEACAWLARLQAVAPAPGVAAFDRRLDDSFFAYKASQVVEWVLPWALGPHAVTDAEATVVREAFALVAREVREAPQRLAHRDYKAANLHLRPGGLPGRRLAMIDLQGALLAPPEYDLVCLLRDSHVALDEELGSVPCSSRPGRRCPTRPDPEVFARRFTCSPSPATGKDLARYLYAARTRGDTRYLALLPRAAQTLRAAARTAAPWDERLERPRAAVRAAAGVSVRAMILAAGLGTRLRPLSEWCAKPAMPIRGIPVIAHTLTLLAKHDVDEVVINLHHLPDSVREGRRAPSAPGAAGRVLPRIGAARDGRGDPRGGRLPATERSLAGTRGRHAGRPRSARRRRPSPRAARPLHTRVANGRPPGGVLRDPGRRRRGLSAAHRSPLRPRRGDLAGALRRGSGSSRPAAWRTGRKPASSRI